MGGDWGAEKGGGSDGGGFRDRRYRGKCGEV
jgi:hypothetical protein